MVKFKECLNQWGKELDMFKFGVNTFIWTEEFTVKDVPLLDKARELGFDVLDIGIMNPDNFPTKKVKEKAKETNIELLTMTALLEHINLIDPSPDVRKNGIKFLKRLVDINVEIGSKIIGGVNYAAAGYLTGRPRTQNEWDWSVKGMREVCLYAKKKGEVVIAVEPINRFETHFLNTAEDAVKYCKDVGTDNIKVQLDSYHMIREELSFPQAVEACGKEFLAYCHVCENNRGIPGTGLVPWKEFFKALDKIPFKGPLVIEAFDPSFKELNRITATWRTYAKTGEDLAVQGLRNLKEAEKNVKKR